MTLTQFTNPSKTSRLRVSTGAFVDEGDGTVLFVPDKTFTVEPGETRSELVDKSRGIFYQEEPIDGN